MSDSPRILVAGQLVGQVAQLVAVVALTHLYSAGELGMYQVAMGVALVALPLATWGYEYLIPVTTSSDAARRVARRAALFSGLITLGLLVVTGVAAALGERTVADQVAMIGLLMSAYAWTVVDNALLLRAGRLRRLGVRNAVSGLLTAALQLAVGMLALPVAALAVALLGARVLAVWATRAPQDVSACRSSVDEGRSRARSASAIGSGVVANASVHVFTLASPALFGLAAAGLVGVAQRATSLPTSFLGQALGQHTMAIAGRCVRERRRDLSRRLRPVLLGIVVLAAVYATAMATIGPLLTSVVLSSEWHGVGDLLVAFAVPSALQLMTASTAPLMMLLGREVELFRLQSFRLLAVVGALLGTYLLTHSAWWSIMGGCAAAAAGYGLICLRAVVAVRSWDASVDEEVRT